jgi:DNA-binding CsgD family transcriptional regulator
LSGAGKSPVGVGNGAGAGSAIAGGDSVIAASNSPASAVPLSRRELQIAHLVESGLTNKQIARELGIEAATVKNHVHNICGKLKVHRRGEAAALIRATVRAQERLRAQELLLTAAPDVNPALAAGLGQA